MMIPPFLTSPASSGLTSTRSARGRTLTDAMLVSFCRLVVGLVFIGRRSQQALKPAGCAAVGKGVIWIGGDRLDRSSGARLQSGEIRFCRRGRGGLPGRR